MTTNTFCKTISISLFFIGGQLSLTTANTNFEKKTRSNRHIWVNDLTLENKRERSILLGGGRWLNKESSVQLLFHWCRWWDANIFNGLESNSIANELSKVCVMRDIARVTIQFRNAFVYKFRVFQMWSSKNFFLFFSINYFRVKFHRFVLQND